MTVPRRIAALPTYIPSANNAAFADAAPGHKFLAYFRNFQDSDGRAFDPYKGKAQLVAPLPLPGPGRRAEQARLKAENEGVLNEVCDLSGSSKAQITALRTRQQALIAHHGKSGYRVTATSTAPFATGLGNEHPIENGFAFLTPYGLPYLAGSGVKGILRRAAEELALENETQQPDKWTWLAVWFLFGFESAVDQGSIWDATSPLGQAFARDLSTTATQPDIYALIRSLFSGSREGARFLDVENRGAEQLLRACMAGKSLRGGLQCRGALDFWDVFPNPAGGKLVVEIMTPHYSQYYRGEQTPHDSGSPIPVSFLAVPVKSQFDFHVVCQPIRLPESLRTQWRALLDRAFQHAFEWVGFGAKTSAGYGAMAAAVAQATSVPFSAGSGKATADIALVSVGASATQTWPTAKLTLNPGTGEIKASFGGQTTAGIRGADADMLRAALGELRSEKLKKNKELKGVSVEVERHGNALQIKSLIPT